ncbi:TetR/AcrR family transcriptional regulator [Phenylobacterium sp.]|uniref:TetR/AcrR family transcriptional regulator n=1 Tax=Phenylobacterium sp. TaxID=1871053 RepID=UPI002732D644|nr:TetR/AcrR family transcriptional regulator [Phenylobacterium sp.]MDP3854156.1 TetR/AcrR family transcriptional regulator [Phenylobacterium sp.]
MPAKRMPREQRRTQLLETASAIVRAEGTDALTLAHLAERAGVTKPIAYEHFGTRAGLLIALYRHYDDLQAQATQAALASRARTLEDVVAILSAAYVDCVLTAGPEFGAIAAALSGAQEMEGFREALRDGYVDLYGQALSRFVDLPGPDGRAVLLGIIGAADALSYAAANGRMARAAAVGALSRIMLGAVSPGAEAR